MAVKDNARESAYSGNTKASEEALVFSGALSGEAETSLSARMAKEVPVGVLAIARLRRKSLACLIA